MKKKELAGNYKNNGQTWFPTGKPIEVNMHDFPDKPLGDGGNNLENSDIANQSNS